MAELSSNWKKLQAQIQAESTREPCSKERPSDSSISASVKRPADDMSADRAKKPRITPQASEQKSRGKSIQMDTQPRPAPTARSAAPVRSATTTRSTATTSSTAPACSSTPGRSKATARSAAPHLDFGFAPAKQAAEPDLSTPDDLNIVEQVNSGLIPSLAVGKYIAIDCEMVGVGPRGLWSILARVSIVDFRGRQVYDSYVRPTEKVTNWRTAVSGITPNLVEQARSFEEVQGQIKALMEGRIVVGHDVQHDLEVLKLRHPLTDLRDTAKLPEFRKYAAVPGQKPSLKRLAREILDIHIQAGSHSSIQDARMTMLLFEKFKSSFDAQSFRQHRKAQTPALFRGELNGRQSTAEKIL